jgi:hypothetical protein
MNNFFSQSSAGGFASSFLNQEVSNFTSPSQFGGGAGGAFSGVMGGMNNMGNSLTSGITQSAQMGIMPGDQQSVRNMTTAQVAAQMNQGGIMSVLPMLGNSFIPKLMFPLAGVISMVEVGKAAIDFARGMNTPRVGFDPSELKYNQATELASNDMEQYRHLGPLYN